MLGFSYFKKVIQIGDMEYLMTWKYLKMIDFLQFFK
jgi:hypothetical protein